MRETADPDVHQDAPPADPEPDQPHPNPTPEPAAEPPHQNDPQPARITVGPVLAMTAETITAASAALWHVGGWTAVGLGAAGLAGAGAAAVAGRRRAGGWKRTRTRAWSTSSSRRAPASFGRASSSGARRGKMPSLGGAGRRAGAGARGGSRAGGMPKSAGRRGFPGAGKPRPGAGRIGAAGRRAAASPMIRGTGRGTRRAMRATGNGLDRATAGALRGRAAARAARQAMRDGGSARAAGRAARAALKDAHKSTPVRGAWKRTLGSAAWGVGGWGIGLLHKWGPRVLRRLGRLFYVRYPDDDAAGEERPRINDTVERPANPATGRHDGGKDTMASKGGGVPQFVHAAQEFAEALRRYEPPPGPGGMIQMYADMGMLPDALEEIAKGFGVFADRTRNELPLHPAISEFVDDLAQTQAGMATVSAEIKPAIEKLHEKDLDRHRTPRPAERLWDVG